MAVAKDRLHGSRVGDLDLLDWDKAVIMSLGAVLDTSKNQYYYPLSGMYVGEQPIERALVAFKKPEPTQLEFDLPCILINRDSFSTAPRLYSPTEQYRVVADGADPVSASGALGWSAHETKPQARPYDLSYTLDVYSRYRTVAQVLIQILMARFPVHGKLTVTDSLGVERVYAAFQESVSDLTEVASLVDRIIGFSLSIRIEGELTLDRVKATHDAFTGAESATAVQPGDPDPGPGGHYATGQVQTSFTILEQN